MALEQIVGECILFGSVFTQAEVLFNSVLVAEHRRSKDVHHVSFPYPETPDSPVRGHSYPIMGLLGALSVPVLHYAPVIPNPVARLAVFGLAIVGTEYVCGKLGYAPWKEVYTYLEARFKQAVPKLQTTRLTLAEGSVFLPFIPVWGSMGMLVSYLHDIIHKI